MKSLVKTSGTMDFSIYCNQLISYPKVLLFHDLNKKGFKPLADCRSEVSLHAVYDRSMHWEQWGSWDLHLLQGWLLWGLEVWLWDSSQKEQAVLEFILLPGAWNTKGETTYSNFSNLTFSVHISKLGGLASIWQAHQAGLCSAWYVSSYVGWSHIGQRLWPLCILCIFLHIAGSK